MHRQIHTHSKNTSSSKLLTIKVNKSQQENGLVCFKNVSTAYTYRIMGTLNLHPSSRYERDFSHGGGNGGFIKHPDRFVFLNFLFQGR